MKPERILVPLDIRKCPLEVFSLLNGLSARPGVTLLLLHVINSKENWEKLHLRELEQRATACLTRLIEENVPRGKVAIPHVRVGQIDEQILQEANQEKVDLIVLPTYSPSWWSKMLWLCAARTPRVVSFLAERIIREASCGVFLAGVSTRSNCAKRWARRHQSGGRLRNTNTVLLDPALDH